MAKSSIIIDGAGVTVTFNSGLMADVVSVAFGTISGRDEIDLTTIDATTYKVGLLGDLCDVEDVTVTKKFDPAAELALSSDNKTLVIAYKVGKATSKTLTYYAQVAGITPGTVSRAPGDGVNVDVKFAITNLHSTTLAETGPVIA